MYRDHIRGADTRRNLHAVEYFVNRETRINVERLIMTVFDIESQIRDYDDWRAPYIGRTIKGNFWEEFKFEDALDKDGNTVIVGVHVLEQNTERPNMFDEETETHGLRVYLSVAKEITQTSDDDAIKHSTHGLITNVVGFVSTCSSTTSNWQDHAETRTHCSVVRNPTSIAEYKRILDACTEETGQDYVFRLFQHIKKTDPLYRDEPIYKTKGGWLFLSVSSTELMTILIYGRSYLEFFFAIHYLAERPNFAGILGSKIERYELVIDWPSRKDVKLHLEKIAKLLGYIDLHYFYKGFDDYEYSHIKMRAIERLVAQSGISRHLFGLPNKVITASINAAIEEMLAKGNRDYRNAFFQDIEFWFNDYGVDVRAASVIPSGSYLFFSDVMGYLGYAREDGSVYIKGSNGGHKFIGTMEDDGSVFDASGVGVCRIEDDIGVCRAKRYHEDRHRKYYGLWMDENGQIFGDAGQDKVRYLGEAYVLEQAVDQAVDFESYREGANPYIKLTRIKKAPNNSCDKRLGGIALLGYMPINEILDIVNRSK